MDCLSIHRLQIARRSQSQIAIEQSTDPIKREKNQQVLGGSTKAVAANLRQVDVDVAVNVLSGELVAGEWHIAKTVLRFA